MKRENLQDLKVIALVVYIIVFVMILTAPIPVIILYLIIGALAADAGALDDL